MSGKPISHARLEAIPFARFTVECQSQLEKQNKASRVRQSVTSLFGLTDEESSEGEEEEADSRTTARNKHMAQEIITLECTEAKALGKPVSRYMSTRNKKSPRTPNRLEKKKYNPFLKRHTLASRNQLISHATENRQTPFRFSPRQPHDAAAPHRHRDRSDRLQESRSAEEIRDRERKDSPAPRDGNAGAHASENHARNQAQPFGALDEIASGKARLLVRADRTLGFSRPLALLDQFPKLSCFAELIVFRHR